MGQGKVDVLGSGRTMWQGGCLKDVIEAGNGGLTRACHAGQPESNLGNDHYQSHGQQTAQAKRDGCLVDIAHGGAFRGHAAHHEQAQAKGRRYPRYLYIDQVGHRKPDIVIAQLSHHGYKDG